MAAVRAAVHTYPEEGVVRVVWEGLLTTDVGAPATISRYPSKTFQVLGTAGAGGSIILQGSMDGTNWFTLHNSVDADLSALTAATTELHDIAENPTYIRPFVTGGDGTTDLDVVILAT